MEERIWHKSYPDEVPNSLEPYPERSLYTILEDAATGFPDRPAIAFLGNHLSYAELHDEVKRMAASLAALGVGRGDRVGLILPNCPQFVIGYYAALRLGAIAVGNNPLYTQRELSHQLADAGCKVVIVLDQLYPTLGASRADLPELEHVIATKVTDYMRPPLSWLAPLKFRKEARAEGRPWPPVPDDADVVWWSDVMGRDEPIPPVAEVDARNDIAALVYTGGTTGLSKGAKLTHFNLMANATQNKAWFPGLEDGEEAGLCVLPFFHSYGMTVCMNIGILRAGKLILIPRPSETDQVLKAIEKERPTLFPGVPRLYIAINEAAADKNVDMTSIKACFSGAAKMPVAVMGRFEAATGATIVEGYGLTETSPTTHANPVVGTRKSGSVGLPFPDTDCRLVELDDPTKEVDQGQPGELLIKGPQVMAGYWNKPEETEQSFIDGWYRTGDVVQMDEDGYFYIVDRIKEMINVSGFNVYPSDVEEVLYQHPKVEKAAVIGVPDDTTGEAVKAFLVLRNGETATPEEIIEWCRDPETGLTGYRVPKHIEFRDSIPETMVGKVLRRELVEEERAKSSA
ncbi:MAG: long-chain-fatty-acid--CoA ligase [Actinomycetota bacterium]